MRSFIGILVVCTGLFAAQTGEDPQVTQAKDTLERLRAAVEAGAAPRAQLVKAENDLADAQDAAVLRRTAYGQDLTIEQAGEMIAAAERRVERRQQALDEAKKLVEAGVSTETALTGPQEDLDRAHKEMELAESRERVTREVAEMAAAEVASEGRALLADETEGSASEGAQFSLFGKAEVAFERQFGKKLPVSAMGQTAVHRSMGFDHTGRVDVALNPDQPEGAWLLEFLKQSHIPYFAFRHAVPGKATGAHIHIGPGSTRIATAGGL